MQQSRLMSFIEMSANTVVSLMMSIALQPIVYPLFDVHTDMQTNIEISFAITGINLIVKYVVRRFFNRRVVKEVQSKLESLVETLVHTANGYLIAVGTHLGLFYLFQVEASIKNTMGIVVVFTVISIVRGYWMRRLFQHIDKIRFEKSNRQQMTNP